MGTTKTQEQVSKAPSPTTVDQIKPAPELQGGPQRLRRSPALGMAQVAESVVPPAGPGDKQRAQKATALQRTLGNTRLARLFSGSGGPQAKIAVGQPNDRYEREAEQVAGRVVSGEKVARISRISADGLVGAVNRQPEEKPVQRAQEKEKPIQPAEEKKEPLQLQRADEEEAAQSATEQEKPIQPAEEQDKAVHRQEEIAAPEPAEETAAAGKVQAKAERRSPTHIEDAGLQARLQAPGGGRPLPESVQTAMETSLGADFGHVRVHDTAQDQADAQQLNARAFTYRNHVWMGPGASTSDQKLMAHELTHVVQQGAALQRAPVPRSAANNLSPVAASVSVVPQKSPAGDDFKKLAVSAIGNEETPAQTSGLPQKF